MIANCEPDCYIRRQRIRVILMVKFGCGGGVARAWRGRSAAQRRRGGHKRHTSLKFEKDG